MSDGLERTIGGATRALFAALGFILLTVAVGMMTDKTGAQLPFGIFLFILGILCFFLWYIWDSAKNILTAEAQKSIDDFARNANTWRAMFVLILGTIILSPFIEQRRWLFSYPTDPAVATENNNLKTVINDKNAAITREKELADKWRFSSGLRQSGLNCQYQLEWSTKANTVAAVWRELFVATGWPGGSKPSTSPTQYSVTIRAKDDPASTQCAEVIQRELSDFYSNPPAKIIQHQQTDFLNSCATNACVQIEVDY